MTRVSIAASEIDSIEVDLWGTLFHTVPVTRTRQRAIRDLRRDLIAIEDDANDAEDRAVRLMAEMLDHMLAAEPGKRKKPSAVVWEKWEADEMAFKQLETLFEDIAEAAAPPT